MWWETKVYGMLNTVVFCKNDNWYIFLLIWKSWWSFCPTNFTLMSCDSGQVPCSLPNPRQNLLSWGREWSPWSQDLPSSVYLVGKHTVSFWSVCGNLARSSWQAPNMPKDHFRFASTTSKHGHSVKYLWNHYHQNTKTMNMFTPTSFPCAHAVRKFKVPCQTWLSPEQRRSARQQLGLNSVLFLEFVFEQCFPDFTENKPRNCCVLISLT